MLRLIAFAFIAFFISACSAVNPNKSYEYMLLNNICTPKAFDIAKEKISKDQDPIFVGLNAGLLARSCDKYALSNDFFDSSEQHIKTDVDLQSGSKSLGKALVSTLINNTIFDYQGNLYERIMVNVYKGLNFMSLNDFKNARVEFNRALMRQQFAKSYFASQIAQNLSSQKDLNKDESINLEKNVARINEQYSQLLAGFKAAKNFTNIYATYLASVFFYLDKDYRKANSLMREVAMTYPNDKAILNQYKIFKKAATRSTHKKHFVFVVYESGLGAIKKQFKLSLPFIIRTDGRYRLISTSIALATLKKRPPSYPYILVNKIKTTQLVDFDNIIATEFRIKLPSMVVKSVVSTILKTGINVAVAKHDHTGGWLALASSLLTEYNTKADIRSWSELPKLAQSAVLPNTSSVDIRSPLGVKIANIKLDKDKNALIIVRSFIPSLPPKLYVIER